MGINHDFYTGSNSNLHTNAAFKYQTNNHPPLYSSGGASSINDIVLNLDVDPATTYRSELTGSVGRALDGTGVDLIVLDGGMNLFHQEFLRDPNDLFETPDTAFGPFDPNNKSRVNFIEWFDYVGDDRTDPSNHYRNTGTGDVYGSGAGEHGTICASLAAGNNFGRIVTGKQTIL